jgi:hypothetical protein
MTRALLTAITLFSLLGCGGDDASAPRTIEGSCAEFCEKVEGSGCTDAGVLDTCMQNCRDDTAEYPACEDEAKAAMHCFARADVECQDTFGGSFPRVVGDHCKAADDAYDDCRQAAMPGSGADAGP